MSCEGLGKGTGRSCVVRTTSWECLGLLEIIKRHFPWSSPTRLVWEAEGSKVPKSAFRISPRVSQACSIMASIDWVIWQAGTEAGPLPCVSSLLNSLVDSFTRSYTQWLGYGPGVCYVSVGCLSMSKYVQGSVPPLHHTVSGSKPVGSRPKGPGTVVLWLEATHGLAVRQPCLWQHLEAPGSGQVGA